MIKKFPQLKPKESIGLDVPIYKNALQLKKDAELIADVRKSYSSATSLLILSSEEVIKSILVKLHSEGYKIYQVKEAHKFFRDHKIRHQIAQLLEVASTFIEVPVKYMEQKPTTFAKTKFSGFNTFINGLFNLIRSLEPLLNNINTATKLQGFNDLKNQGLYVDYSDKLLSPQIEVTRNTYKETLIITNRIFKFSKYVRILYHHNLANHKDAKDIKELQKDLKKLVDDNFKKISFKEMNKTINKL